MSARPQAREPAGNGVFTALSDTGTPVCIGSLNGTNYLDGRLDDVLYLSRPLTDAELLWLDLVRDTT